MQWLPVCMLLLLPLLSRAQEGYSSASMSMAQMRASALQVPLPEEIVVEEYVNYHRHAIPRPSGRQGAALDLAWGERFLAEGGARAVLQVGVATAKQQDLEGVPPVNLSLVIDKSGSMSGDRIAKALQAAHTLVDRLREGDIISIVAFDHLPELILPATVIRNHRTIHAAVDRIRIGGSTNMNAGMLMGYEQLVRNYKKGRANRILFLTDALTNTGVVDPSRMLANSTSFNAEYEVDFTIVGVGVNFNNALSRKLTGGAKGSIHFINDATDIQKVFVNEVDALLSPIGRDVVLELAWEDDAHLRRVFGYAPERGQRTLRIPLDNINGGLTMVVLCEFEIPAWWTAPPSKVTAQLRYKDVRTGKAVRIEQSATVSAQDYRKTNPEVSKNYAIARLAQGLQDMSTQFYKGSRVEARRLITAVTQRVQMNALLGADPDVARMLRIVDRYAGCLPEVARGH